jgi:hypothetical protein
MGGRYAHDTHVVASSGVQRDVSGRRNAHELRGLEFEHHRARGLLEEALLVAAVLRRVAARRGRGRWRTGSAPLLALVVVVRPPTVGAKVLLPVVVPPLLEPPLRAVVPREAAAPRAAAPGSPLFAPVFADQVVQ